MATPTSLPDAPPVPHLDTEQLQSAYGKEILGYREPVTALTEPPRYQKAAAHQFLQTPPTISISKTRSESNMHRGFSFRRANSNAGPKAVTEKPLPVMPGHSRNHSIQSAASWQQNGALLPGPSSGGLQRSMSKRQKFVRAITNPDKIFDRDPASPPPESRYVHISVTTLGFNSVLPCTCVRLRKKPVLSPLANLLPSCGTLSFPRFLISVSPPRFNPSHSLTGLPITVFPYLVSET